MIKKIVCVINGVGSSGGAERVMVTLCNEFVKKGIKVTLIVQEKETPSYFLEKDVEVLDTTVYKRIPGFLRLCIRQSRLRKHIRSCRPDVVISFMTKMNILTLIASLGLHIPIIVSERIDPHVNNIFPINLIRKIVYPFSSGYVFQTESAKTFFSNRIQAKSMIIPNPLSEGLPIKVNYLPTHEIVAVGRLEYQKNYSLLIYAFYDFIKIYNEFVLKIYGTGSKKQEIQQMINKMGMEKKIFLMGSVPNVAEEIYSADMFVMTSDYEGMPNSLAEALAVGLPCISTDCIGGGARFLIENDINGILVPTRNIKLLVAAMNKIENNHDYAKRIGNEAIKIRKKLNSEKIAQQWLNYCDQIGKEYC